MLLALDMATCTGWCAGDGSAMPRVGHVQLAPTKDGRAGQKFDEFRRFLALRIDEFRPTQALFEKPILPKPFLKNGRIIWPTSIETTQVLQGLAALAEAEFFARGIPYDSPDFSTVKKELAGHGGADKAAMVRVARRVGLDIAVDDEADAFAVWLVGVRLFAKQYSQAWDSRVWSRGRGALL